MSSAPGHRHAPTSRFSLGAEVTLAVLLVLCPLALGGGGLWVLWPLVGLAGLALALACLGARRQGHSLHVPWLALPCGAGAALCLLQLVPLPPGALALLSPEAAALREFVLVPLGLDGARPLSLDPPATWRELAKHLAYLLAFVAAVQVCRSRRARRRLLITLAATGAGVAGLGLLHALLGLTRLLGVIPYVHAQPPLVTPFGNPNHLAGFLGLSATVAVGLALSSGRRSRALPLWLAAVLSGVGVVLSLSRGGIAFFLFGQLALALLVLGWRRSRREQGAAWRAGAAALGCLLAALVVGGYAAAERLSVELAEARSVEALRRGKVELWPMMGEAARAFPLTGMGRGAFEAAFPRYQTEPNPNTLTHPENLVLQLAAELGVPGLLLLALALWGLGRLPRREGLGPAELAVLAGVAALGLHNLFDFSLELPACAVAVLVALATVASPEARSRSQAGPRGLAPVPVLVAGTALCLLGLAALVPGRHTLSAAEAELSTLIAARAPLAEVRARGLALIERHPANHALPGLIGAAYAAAGSAGAREALAFANRALYLRPLDAWAHRVAARALLVLGHRTQGFLEYRLASESGDEAVLVKEALGRARTLEELQALTPDSARGAVELVVALTSRPGRQEDALAYLAWAREHFDAAPEALGLWEREAHLRLSRGEHALAEAACAEVARRAPEALASHLLRAEVLRAQGRHEEALRTLEGLRGRFPGDVELSFSLARQQLEAGLPRRARETLQQLGPLLTELNQRARLFMLEGESFEREGSLARALEAWQAVTRLQPGPSAWFKVARLHEALHQLDAAAQAVREGLRLLPPGARAEGEAWIARLEAEERGRTEERRRERLGAPRDEALEDMLRAGGEEGTEGRGDAP